MLSYRPYSMSVENIQSKYEMIFEYLRAHHEWFAKSLPLIASENIPSPAVREAIVSDFGNRYAERM